MSGDELDDLRFEVTELLDVLSGVVAQACQREGDVLDSMALSYYADGIRKLAEHGRVHITNEVGRRVIAKWNVGGEVAR